MSSRINCALFARYSSKMQDEMSLDAQVYEMETFASKQGWQIVERYLLPETRSSMLERSPEWERMLADAKAKRWKVLLLHKLDRLGRDRDLVVITKASLRRLGVEIKSVVENLNQSIEHRMLEGVFELFSDFYAKNLGQETKKGHRQLVRQGFWTGGKVPWGLALETVETGKKAHKRLVEDSFKGPIMRGVFHQLADGHNTVNILDWIEAHTGERWQWASFYTRIRNPIYYGRIEYERTNLPAGRPRQEVAAEDRTIGAWAGLVSEEIWRKANDVINERGKNMQKHRRRNPHEPYLLSEHMTCSRCGHPIVGSSAGGGNRYYYCSHRRDGCVKTGGRVDEVEPAVLDAIARALAGLDEAALIKEFRTQLEPLKVDSRTQEAEMRRELAEGRARQKNLLNAIETGSISPDMVSSRMQELKARENDLVDRIATCQIEADVRVEINEKLLAELIESLREQLQGGQEKAREDLAIALKHLFHVELDLETGEGHLLVQMPLSGRNFGISYGRSARYITYPKIRVRSFWVPRNRIGVSGVLRVSLSRL